MQNVPNADNLHEMSNPIFWINYDTNLLSAELARKVVTVPLPQPPPHQKRGVWTFHACVSVGNNMHEMSNHIFWVK